MRQIREVRNRKLFVSASSNTLIKLSFRNVNGVHFVMKMYLSTFFILLVTRLTVNSEKHSLMYIYTGFSKPVGLPGIHQFTAMGLLDGMMIDYYDSDVQRKVPKQDWMKEKLTEDYWEKGTQSRQSKQEWFKVNIDILKKRMNQNDDDLHDLQWMVGCEGETLPNGTLKFVRGVNMYSYNGRDFLSFDDTNSVWVAATDIAIQTKRKWDHEQDLKEKTKIYLEKECIDWLDRFMVYRNNQTQAAHPPNVYMFAKKTRIESNLMLTCLVTGLHTKDLILNIKRNDRILTKEDGLISSDVRPNEDDSFQRRDSVEILKSDTASFTCEVIHKASNMSVKKVWDHKVYDEGNNGGVIGGVIGGLIFAVLLVVVVLVVLKKRRIMWSRRRLTSADDYVLRPPLSSDASGSRRRLTSADDYGSDDSVSSGDSGQSAGSDNNSENGSDTTCKYESGRRRRRRRSEL